MTITFVILAITVLLFVFSKISPDLVSLMALLALFLTGIITTGEALAGFSDNTVILIAALFVVGESISRTGFGAWLGQNLVEMAGSSNQRLLVLVMIATAFLSAFISNTGTVAMMVPVVIAAAWRIQSVPSKLLLPVAVAANIAGSLTLISTATNIIASDTLEAAGLEPFGFFEFTWVGLPLVAVTVLFMAIAGRRLLPCYQPHTSPVDVAAAIADLAEDYSLEGQFHWLNVPPGSELIGQTLAEADLIRDYDVLVVHIQSKAPSDAGSTHRRGDLRRRLRALRSAGDAGSMPDSTAQIEANDVLVVKGAEKSIDRLAQRYRLGVEPITNLHQATQAGIVSETTGPAEVIIGPRSEHIGQSVSEANISVLYDVQVLGGLRQGLNLDLRRDKLRIGDTLLVRGKWEAIQALGDRVRDFIVIGEPGALADPAVRLGPRSYLALTILLGMVILMLTGCVPTVMAAVIADVVIVLTGILSTRQAYESINWSVIVLIGALLPMGTALQKTGGVELLAGVLINTLGVIHPLLLMGGIFVLASMLSQIISNTATAVLISPIALVAATELGISPYPMLMCVALAVTTGILTPVAGAPMLIVMTPGQYKFSDYVKVGLPLLGIVFAVVMALVPLLWPL